MLNSGIRSRERGQTKRRRRISRGRFHKRVVLTAVLALAPLATKVVELVILIIKSLK